MSIDKHSDLFVQFNKQVWMDANLNLDSFRNGDTIPQVKTVFEWRSACENELPVWLYYDFDDANGDKYGKLYNWWAVNDSRGLAPIGWHIPSDDEWSALLNYLNSDHILSEKSEINSAEKIDFKVAVAEDGGSLTFPLANFSYDLVKNQKSESGGWWSSSGLTLFECQHHGLNISNGFVSKAYFDRVSAAFSVRCLRD